MYVCIFCEKLAIMVKTLDAGCVCRICVGHRFGICVCICGNNEGLCLHFFHYIFVKMGDK